MEQQTGSKLGKEYVKAVYFHPTCYLLCRVYHAKCQAGQSTSWNQDCQENINNLRYANDTTLMAEGKEELKSLLIRVKEESEKAGLKLSVKKSQDPGIRFQHFMANRRGKSGSSDRFYFLGLQNLEEPKIFRTVSVATKLKDACSLKEKL